MQLPEWVTWPKFGRPLFLEPAVRSWWYATFVVSVLLVACTPQPSPPKARPAASARAGSVSISGDDTLVQVLSWSLPVVQLVEQENVAAARRTAQRGLAKGDLFETAESAIPLYLALQRLDADDAASAKGVADARLALIAQGDAALAAGDEDLLALRAAQRRAAVLRKLWPQEPEVLAYLQRVDLSERIWDRNAEGEAALTGGQYGESGGGALAAFRAALALRPGQARASQGVAAVESGLVRHAELAALRGEFDDARVQLGHAERVRHAADIIAAARRRIDIIREERVRRLRDEGLIALGDGNGLRTARERLAEMLRIAPPADPSTRELRERIDLATHYGVFRPGQVFTDGLVNGSRGPQLVVVPHGAFLMGAPENEPDATAAEQPQHVVRLERGFAMSRNEISVAEFGRFIAATRHETRAAQRGHSMAYDARSGNFVRGSGIDWRSTYAGSLAGADMPVVHVTARDSEAFAEWLSRETGAQYRLPSEAEFEYALRAGGSTRFPWGDGAPPAGSENLTGGLDRSPQGRSWSNAFMGYGDGWWGPAPVGSMSANAYGLHDMAGNVSEWVADCWHQGYRRAPATGAAWINPGCRNRMYRGGSWASAPAQSRAAWRTAGGIDVTNARVGFRVVRQL